MKAVTLSAKKLVAILFTFVIGLAGITLASTAASADDSADSTPVSGTMTQTGVYVPAGEALPSAEVVTVGLYGVNA